MVRNDNFFEREGVHTNTLLLNPRVCVSLASQMPRSAMVECNTNLFNERDKGVYDTMSFIPVIKSPWARKKKKSS